MKTLLIALFAIGPAFAQEAKIMIVEKPDSQKLQRAYQDYKDALKHWEESKAQVAKQYTQSSGKTIEGWEKVQFSADFRAIVPESSQYAGRSNWCYGGGITLTSNVPAVGSINYPDTTIYGGLSPLGDLSVNQNLTVKEK